MPFKKAVSKNANEIVIKGARVNNLKNIDVNIPRDKFVVITGLSGSGKSSLAFDTIYAEGNRRYMEGLSSYARNFLEPAIKPDIDKIENLSPPISIDQKSISRSPRSTVGTLTEVYDYMRILFAKVGILYCPNCGASMQKKSNQEILDEIMEASHHTQIAILARLKESGKTKQEILRQIQQLGYARVRIGGPASSLGRKMISVAEAFADETLENSAEIDVVIDRVVLDKKRPDMERIVDSIETAMKVGSGAMKIVIDNNEERGYNQDFFCAHCGIKVKEITPRHFSFNSPEGACATCSGLGYTLKVNPELVIPNKKLSLNEGAVQPWSKSGGKINSQNNHLAALHDVAKKHTFTLDTPIRKLNAVQLKAMLYGSGAFEGVIPSLEKRYLETKSDYLRDEIEKYMTSSTCEVCHGKRLKAEYLSVKVNDKSIDDLVNMGATGLKQFFAGSEQWKTDSRDKKISQPIIREMVQRLVALENVGLEYLSLGRSAQTISGGEAQRGSSAHARRD